MLIVVLLTSDGDVGAVRDVSTGTVQWLCSTWLAVGVLGLQHLRAVSRLCFKEHRYRGCTITVRPLLSLNAGIFVASHRLLVPRHTTGTLSSFLQSPEQSAMSLLLFPEIFKAMLACVQVPWLELSEMQGRPGCRAEGVTMQCGCVRVKLAVC
jgi:hypothetical protein